MSKKNMATDEEKLKYFQTASTFEIDEKLRWYSFILVALVLANEEEKSKDGKRFKYDFERHKIVIEVIEALLHAQSPSELEGVSRDYSRGIIPLLKANCQQLRNAIVAQLVKLFQECVNNTDLYAEEKTFWENPTAIHAAILDAIGMLPHVGMSDEFQTAKRAAYTHICEQLYKACEVIEQEISSGTFSAIRSAWLVELLMTNDESIIHVYGKWRFIQMLNGGMLRDFRFTGQDLKKPEGEKDQRMFEELQMLHSDHDENVCDHEENQSDLDEADGTASHDRCECCHEHE